MSATIGSDPDPVLERFSLDGVYHQNQFFSSIVPWGHIWLPKLNPLPVPSRNKIVHSAPFQ